MRKEKDKLKKRKSNTATVLEGGSAIWSGITPPLLLVVPSIPPSPPPSILSTSQPSVSTPYASKKKLDISLE